MIYSSDINDFLSNKMNCKIHGNPNLEIKNVVKFDDLTRSNDSLCWASSKNIKALSNLKEGMIICSLKNTDFSLLPETTYLYRRQDYPKCFEISHYVSIFKAGLIYKLNRNCDSTIFYPIPDVIDVDTQKKFIRIQ